MPAASKRKRVSRVLHLVDELELDAEELRVLRDELAVRQECEIDLEACKTEEDRALAVTIKRRIDAVARGEAKLVPVADVLKSARHELRRHAPREGDAFPVFGRLLRVARRASRGRDRARHA